MKLKIAFVATWLLFLSVAVGKARGENTAGLPADSIDDVNVRAAMQAATDAGSWLRLKCVPESRAVCNGTECKQAEPAIYLILDRGTSTFKRCDSKGCDAYP